MPILKKKKQNSNMTTIAFNIYVENIHKKKINEEICYNAILLTAEHSAISCGYYELKLNFKDGSTGNYKSCFLFNDDILSTKNLVLWTKMTVEDMATNAEYD